LLAPTSPTTTSISPVTGASPVKPVGLVRARHLFTQLAQALDYLHSRHIAHHDIKPSNVLVRTDPNALPPQQEQLKLVDFGIAEELDPAKPVTQLTQGTPAFFAPERCTPGHASSGSMLALPPDVWAAGVTLYSWVVGDLPFSGGTAYLLYEAIRTRPLVIPDTMYAGEGEGEEVVAMPCDLGHLLECMLDKDPERRITMSQVLQHPWVVNAVVPHAL
jgi:calcium/calmodulin-dependent protein kinase kinase 2